MTVLRKMIQKALDNLEVKTYLFKDLSKAGVSDIQIQRTPIATRITAKVRKPGMVVGKKGNTIKEVCDELQTRFGIENPQFEVIEVTKPALDAKLMAEKIGQRIEMRPNVKPIMRMALREILEAGALGAEIQVAGKVVGKGGKAKALRVRGGYLRKSGEPKKQVRRGHYVAYLKAGAIGVLVKIVPPGSVFPDVVNVPKPSEETEKLFAQTPPTSDAAMEPEEKEQEKQKPAEDQTKKPAKRAARKTKKIQTSELQKTAQGHNKEAKPAEKQTDIDSPDAALQS